VRKIERSIVGDGDDDYENDSDSDDIINLRMKKESKIK